METIIFLFALFAVSLGNVVPRHPNEDLIRKAIRPQHPNAGLFLQPQLQNGRIIGGQDVEKISDYPWQASLRFNGYHTCGAVIIGTEWLVTAAHCVDGRDYSLFSVKIGDVSLSSDEAIVLSVTQIIEHESYNQGFLAAYPNDIAVLKVPSMEFNENVNQVKLPTTNADGAGQTCTISGWGYTDGTAENKVIPDTLQHADVKIYTNTECQSKWGIFAIISSHICIGDVENGRGSCNGDSGGPLTCEDTLYGVTSWGAVGCDTDSPSVYTRISSFRNWISQKTGI